MPRTLASTARQAAAATIATGALLLGASSQAQTRPGVPVRPFVSAGVTYGGDTLESFDFSNDTSSKVRAGGIFHVMAGVDFLLGGPVSGQVNIGWHFDSANGSNGDYEFSRMPVEALVFVSLTDRFRLGGGLRKALDAQVDSSGAVGGFDSSFRSSTGVVVEGEYFFTDRFSMKARAVSEKYKGKDGVYSGRSFDGTHGGLYASFYFF